MPIPINVQIPLFTKILSFDRNFKSRAGTELVIGIIYQTNFRISSNAEDQFMTVIMETPIKEINGIPIKCLPIELRNDIDLASIITQNNVDILYITPMRSFDIKEIIVISQTKQILTITGVPEYVDAGLAVGIGLKSDKPMIIINLEASKADGADFHSQLLKLAKVIQ